MFCQELAGLIAAEVIPVVASSKVNLVCVGIGTHARALEFCQHTSFPPRYLWSDENNTLYDALSCVKSTPATLFTDVRTPLALAKRLQSGKMTYLNNALGRWAGKMWIPPKLEQGLQQGGAFVFKGSETLYSYRDPAAGVHVDLDQVIKLALAAAEPVALL